ncbi:uncharacterized protein BCR38DRAFT_94532 [Pseudomassariella vexata]|uniref:Uncharacterized protein n=1 Tax=Pseudomassariella vexata TaxID=1141098 RepID=A0A1Y2EF31_9PEZI|nr:uncharacterized protein BCR38DRAFT_94532 [Pseudomassariella vexata]ORY69876.1 hypothetical protein BCR38DRAFT_94532 [Pseudomassariella vexata]
MVTLLARKHGLSLLLSPVKGPERGSHFPGPIRHGPPSTSTPSSKSPAAGQEPRRAQSEPILVWWADTLGGTPKRTYTRNRVLMSRYFYLYYPKLCIAFDFISFSVYRLPLPPPHLLEAAQTSRLCEGVLSQPGNNLLFHIFSLFPFFPVTILSVTPVSHMVLCTSETSLGVVLVWFSTSIKERLEGNERVLQDVPR